ncbi:MAG: hypothetical protein EAZ66_07260, partial [Alphaproteobacteria bacterium]
MQLAYTTYGKLNDRKDNIIWICHAFTANARTTDWWEGMVGENDFFNPKEHFVICANVLGSPYGSSSPVTINPKTGENYIIQCQEYLKQTEIELRKFPIKEIHLKVWNDFFRKNTELNIELKTDFKQIDWNWLTQDFHLFVYRNVLKLYKPKNETEKIKAEIQEDFEPVSVEGQSKLAVHMRYERDSNLIKKIKEKSLLSNPMLNCEVCGFSFFEKYGELGQGFIEA